MKGIKAPWDDKIKQKRDIMIDIPLDKAKACYNALQAFDNEWMEGNIYFVIGKYNNHTARIYIELSKRSVLKLSVFNAEKVFRNYLLSYDYLEEVKSLPILYEYGFFQTKISRVPDEDEINDLCLEDLRKLKPYLPTLVNHRICFLAKDLKEAERVQKLPIPQDEGNRLFFAYINNKVNEYNKPNK